MKIRRRKNKKKKRYLYIHIYTCAVFSVHNILVYELGSCSISKQYNFVHKKLTRKMKKKKSNISKVFFFSSYFERNIYTK